MKYLYMLDTNMFSYIARGTSSRSRLEFQRLSQDSQAVLCVSSIAVAEIRYGMSKHKVSPNRKSAIERLLQQFQILTWGDDEASAYGELRAKLESRGITIQNMDLLIAAHAVATGAVLVTHDGVFQHVDDLNATVDWATDLT